MLQHLRAVTVVRSRKPEILASAWSTPCPVHAHIREEILLRKVLKEPGITECPEVDGDGDVYAYGLESLREVL